MLKLSKKVDYGLMAISHIAYCEDDQKIVNTKRIAEEYSIPVELLAKILQKMAKGGLITSLNGPKGGYVLARPPRDITVGQVVNAIEGPIELVHCYREDETECQQLGKCSVRKPIRRIQDSIARLLDSITIEEITRLS
ncbi:MAG: Rrf2 family transcriptional regulator [Nitrospirae bacterium]|nr:Rrf2 family transcriptional regulator [Nitrospirota bacterium]